MDAPVLIQLPVNAPKPVQMPGLLHPRERPLRSSSRLLTSDWPSSSCCNRVGNEPIEGRYSQFILSILYLSLCNSAFETNKSFERERERASTEQPDSSLKSVNLVLPSYWTTGKRWAKHSYSQKLQVWLKVGMSLAPSCSANGAVTSCHGRERRQG